MNPQAMLKLLLGASEGDVMYAIYSAYADKLKEPGTRKRFDIDEDSYVSKSCGNIAEYVGIQASAVKRAIGRLVKKGLLQKKPSNKETNNIPLYKPELRSDVFIKIAEEKLKNLTTDNLDRPLNKKCIPQIIETLEKNSCVLVALGLIQSSQETKSPQEIKSSQESNPPEEKDELIIKYVSVLQRKWGEECE
jgi:predicted transcriptional regulator